PDIASIIQDAATWPRACAPSSIWPRRLSFGIARRLETRASAEVLVAPNFWARTQSSPSISTAELNEFIEKAVFVWRSINMFNWVNHHDDFPEPDKTTWLQIFGQPVT